jgi:GT2 family glycosyltransferase
VSPSSAPDARVDVLIPTCDRPAALAVLLTSLSAQTWRDFRLVVSDQSEDEDALRSAELCAVVAVLRLRGHEVTLGRHLPRRGLAEHRQALLDQARAPYCLFLDDDLILAPELLERLVATIERERCGFVGCGLIGPTYSDDVRPHEQVLEPWDGPVEPEEVRPDLPSWERYRLHNAANLLHVQQRLELAPGDTVTYRVAWVGGCVLYDVGALRAVGGFQFWSELPAEHAGEDVLAQLRVMERYGGCGVLPSGAYHQELPTTVSERGVDAPHVLPVSSPPR